LTDDFEEHIPNYFETSTPCDAHYLLGIRITRNRNPPPGVQPWISLDQVTFTESTLAAISNSFQHQISIRRTVFPVGEIVPNDFPKNLADPSHVRRFQSAVGQLMYLMLATRPDLAYPVGILARYASNPSPQHKKALLHLIGYIQHTKEYTLTFFKPRATDQDPGIINAFSDADWAGETHSGRSTTGMVIMKNGSAISWSSKRQGVVSTSTMESEYIALFNTVQNAIFMSNLEEQFHTVTWYSPNILCDNQAAIAVASGGDMEFKRSKFMNVKYHYVRQIKKKDLIEIHYVKSADNTADLFTKRLPHGSLSVLRGHFMTAMDQRNTPNEAKTLSPVIDE
jgi:hypothetical protein